MTRFQATFIALAVSLPSVVLAGPYIGVGLGGSRIETSLVDIGLMPSMEADAASIDPDLTSTDVGIQILAGYRFGSWLGIEVGYADLGDARQAYELEEICDVIPPTTGCQSREWTAEIKTKILQAYLTGYYPLHDKVEVYGKVGVVRWDSDFAAFERHGLFVEVPAPGGSDALPPVNPEINYNDDGSELALALGFNLKTDSAFSLRTEFAWFDIENTDQAWLLSLNAIYNF